MSPLALEVRMLAVVTMTEPGTADLYRGAP